MKYDGELIWESALTSLNKECMSFRDMLMNLDWIKGKVYLVTGGAGFIGSHLSEALLLCGASRVVVLDDLSTGRRENLHGLDLELIDMRLTAMRSKLKLALDELRGTCG